MTPIAPVSDWLDRQSTETLQVVLFLCGLGIYLTILYVVVACSERGFRITRGRRWWR